ncbi:predicted protein [Uncinocarpus reesii 1704]|uniref:Uncharacterized protein n=1 Tax=Uncinocarpus reesii (strain UAMH 1704) TaxID=336963 RepID=C4JEF3_UNCRE|nr:uncharacterized protein UREG_00792 [Uncinocarpus reesii 1704]EEP75945.1 predicted protein [Uncinocarpus reesii 1704]
MTKLENGIALKEEQFKTPFRSIPSNNRSKARAGLAIWYSLWTAFFRCPTDLTGLNEQSPLVCKPYLIARSRLEPHVTPYYRIYAEPYAMAVRPYALALQDRVYIPVANISSKTYRTYGAPRVQRVLLYSKCKWDALVSPQLQSFKLAMTSFYDSTIGPYVEYVKATVIPQYVSASGQLVRFRDGYVVPAYSRLKPVTDAVYVSTHRFLARTAIPYSRRGWSGVVAFFNNTLLPRLAGLYFENVEPQLLKIGAKLASYREGGKFKRLQEDAERFGHSPPFTIHGQCTHPESFCSLTESFASATSFLKPSMSVTPMPSEQMSPSTETAASASSTLSPTRERAQEQIGSDLKTWQEKFALAADKGCDELEKEVVAVVENLRNSGTIDEGEKLVSELGNVTQIELKELKARINDIVRGLSEDADSNEEKAAQQALTEAVRASGFTIRERAHSLRTWFDEYDGGLMQHISAVVGSTLDILDNIRDLGLQEIGMRWAWMDGVTYKDWAKFHALKKQFSEWHDEVRNVGMENEALLEARATGDDILSRGMAIAEKAAKELLMIKKVGIWKTQTGDTSDNFDISVIDPAKVRSKTKSNTGLGFTPVMESRSSSPQASAEELPADSIDERRSSSENIPRETRDTSETTVPTQNAGSPVLQEASAIILDAVDRAETASSIAEAEALHHYSTIPEAAQKSIHERVNDVYSESLQEAAVSLESRAQETSMVSDAQPTSNIIGDRPQELVADGSRPENTATIDEVDADTPAEIYMDDDSVVFGDDQATPSIIKSSEMSQRTWTPEQHSTKAWEVDTESHPASTDVNDSLDDTVLDEQQNPISPTSPDHSQSTG